MRILITVLSLAFLAGCTAPASLVREGKTYRNDLAYMAAVESKARGKGVDVHWVNPPRELVEAGTPPRIYTLDPAQD